MPVRTDRDRVLLAALLALVFLTVLSVKKCGFPLFSINCDEAAFVFQTEMFADGKIRTESPEPAESFRQWFIIDEGGKRFSKYPFGASLLFLPAELAGDRDLALPVIATLNVFLFYLLLRGFFPVRQALTISLFLFLNPFFIVLSSLFLSHGPCLLYLLGALLCYLRILRKRSTAAALSTGLLMGLAFQTRPLTAVAFGLALCVTSLVLLTRDFRAYAVRFLLACAGFGLVFSLYLAYNRIVAGDPLRIPFTLWCADDRYGFGPRRQSYEDPLDPFTVEEAAKRVVLQTESTVSKLFGGAGLSFLLLAWSVPCVIYGAVPPRTFAISLLFILSQMGLYFFHYGAAFPPFLKIFGNFYYFELLPFFSVLAFYGYSVIGGKLRRRSLRCLWLISLCSLSMVSIHRNLGVHGAHTRARKAEIEPVLSLLASGERALVFVPEIRKNPRALGMPFPTLRNHPEPEKQEVLFALDLDEAQNAKAIDSHGAGRTLYRMLFDERAERSELVPYRPGGTRGGGTEG